MYSNFIHTWSINTVDNVHGKNGTWIIHGGTRKITMCSSTFYGVNSNFRCRHTKNYYTHRKIYWNTP